MAKIRQIDLPEEVRAKFPVSLGTLKQIKVLTNAEFAELQPGYIPKKQDEYNEEDYIIDWVRKRFRCVFYQRVSTSDINRNHIHRCVLKDINAPKKADCINCKATIPKNELRIKKLTCNLLLRQHPYIPIESTIEAYGTSTPLLRQGCFGKPLSSSDRLLCVDCEFYEQRSRWSITFNIQPIETHDIIVTSIHYHREKIKPDFDEEDLD